VATATGALDYTTGKLVLDVIARINRELGTTAVVITPRTRPSAAWPTACSIWRRAHPAHLRNEHKISPAELSW